MDLKTYKQHNEDNDTFEINYKDLIGKKCKRENSDVVWEIWASDEDGVAVMNYSSSKPMSRRIKIPNFIKNWIIVQILVTKIIIYS